VTVMVQRELSFFPDGEMTIGAVRVFAPLPDDQYDQSWGCEYELEWPGYTRRRKIFGVDAWQALQLAMQIIPHAISATDDFKAGRIGIWGNRLFSYEELCDVFGVKPAGDAKQ